MAVWPVVLDSWQIECCGTPCSVGDVVDWALVWTDAAGSELPAELHVRRALSAHPVPARQDGAGGALLTAGALTAWLPRNALAGRLELCGLLREEHHGGHGYHGDLPTTTGVVLRIRVLRLTALVNDGKLEVVVAKTFPLDQAVEATRLLASQHAGGKVVLLP